ncbi:CoA transferase [Amycolatopsis acidiphila]|uniref:CoA transferase n=1 Tax=Amycolatopsis acidiphila TaxID=715473 RepID=A0A558A8B9_9PSEU|nr:CoA transferase [Amycolatopsis acidiphila]TVT20510.1 CoA transferase [Amycolatopsis acidiphila]UIJ57035.1 CoA transferase [Amycolatopsis acidiphila]GHG53729.1 CoA transferase [Amycolatopsis acidiphila]
MTADGVTGVPEGRRLSVLDGVRVLDLTRFLAGPFGAMVLADLGADVLKVEQLTGDSTRANPPYFHQGDSAYFLAINRNKRSIALDIRSPEGKRILRELIADSDVVLDNLRAPQRKALGLSFEDISAVNPKIVSVSVTGFGSDGPYADRPAYDIIVEALAGVMSVTGPVGGPSVRAGVPIGDITAGLYAAIAALAGLQTVRSTGRGTHLDVGMLDCQVSLLSYLAQYYFTGGLVATHQGREHVSIPTYNTFSTKDGTEIVIAANTQEQWLALCGVLGREDLAAQPRFRSNPERLRHRDELVPILREEVAKWHREDLDRALVEAEVPVAPINTIDVALRNPQVRHREMVVRSPHRRGGDFLTIGVPVKSRQSPGAKFQSPPALGGDTVAVLHRLGYSDGDIARLQEADVLRAAAGDAPAETAPSRDGELGDDGAHTDSRDLARPGPPE